MIQGYRSGQTGQTVNLLAQAFAGSNPAPWSFLMNNLQLTIYKTNLISKPAEIQSEYLLQSNLLKIISHDKQLHIISF